MESSPNDTPGLYTGHVVEPAMYLQRPTSERSQDISHIFSSTFRELFAKDTVLPKTVKHLSQSRAGGSSYHDRYAERLQKVQSEWEKEVELIKVLESHILTAKSEAREVESQMLKEAAKECKDYDKLGLPPVPSQLSFYLNGDMLRSKHLIVPEDFIQAGDNELDFTKQEVKSAPNYTRPTTSSLRRASKTEPDTNYYPELINSLPLSKFSSTPHEYDIIKINHSQGTPSMEPIVERQVHGVSADTKLRSKTKVWKDSMKPQNRQADREDLFRLQATSDYKKNPRFVGGEACSKRWQKKVIESENTETEAGPKEDFAVSPRPILFKEYEPGKIYELPVKLKNITNSGRQVRVLPPSSKYFAVGLGQFPSDNGVVAPGMSCHYMIYFRPDCLGDFHDTLQVVTLSSGSVSIPIIAARTPPELKLPNLFDCGYALVNTIKEVTFECHNIGGPGQFCILPKDNWPTVEWNNTLDSPGFFELNGFQFEPAMVYLNSGDRVTFKVTFSPKAVATYQGSIMFICDNCQVKEFEIKGTAELPGVELESVQGGLSEYKLGEFKDQSSQYLIRFNDQHPLSSERRKLFIKNTTAVPLSFKWLQRTPNLGNKAPRSGTFSELSKVAFSIRPSSGKLTEKSRSAFELTFHPKQVGSFHSILNLVLEKIPSNGTDCAVMDLLAMSLELKGESKPHQILVSPLALIPRGEHLFSTTFTQKIMIANSSHGNVRYTWPPFENERCCISFHPEHGILGGEEKVEIDIFITGKIPGRIQEPVPCQVPHAEENIFIYVDMTFVGPKLKIIPSFLDFGLVRHLDHRSQEFNLLNRSPIPLEWSIVKATDNIVKGNDEMLSVETLEGWLEPHAEQKVVVHLNALIPMVLHSFFEIKVKNGESRFLEVHANVQRPCVCVQSSILKISNCFMNIPVIQKITFHNQTLLVSDYRFVKVVGNDIDAASLSFHPSEGTLKPRASKTIEVTFMGKRQGEINDLIALFEVVGAAEYIPLSLNANVEGLAIEYIIPTEDQMDDVSSCGASSNLKIDFGEYAQLGQVIERYLIIRNKTAIPCKFGVTVELFSGPEQKKALEDKAVVSSDRHRIPVLSKLEAPSSQAAALKQIEDIAKNYLKKGKGICFIPQPPEGTLDPFGQQLVTVTLFSDMWGRYSDVLLCQVEDLPVQRILMFVNVVGCPLNLQMSKDQPPIIRFGNSLSGTEPVVRRLRVNNTSPFDIRTHWEPYVLDSEDTKLLDLNVYYGNAFPATDENGREIDEGDLTWPLIRVHLADHQGKQVTKPFDVKPKQMVIPARGNATVEVLFHPLEGIRSSTDFIGYALGHMCLKKEDREIPSKCNRLDAENTLPFTINMTGTVKPARIWIESHEDDAFNFYVPVSNLYGEKEQGQYQLQKEWSCSHRVTISNSTGAKLKFTLATVDPFEALVVESSIKKPKSKGAESEICLDSSKKCEVKISFNLTMALLDSIENSSDAVKDEEESSPKATKVERKLLIKFCNGGMQVQTVTAHLMWPCVKLSANYVDFGTCFVGERLKKYLILKNSGRASWYWTAQIDPNYPDASHKAFELLPRSGFLSSVHDENEKENKQSLSISFCPLQNFSFECRILLVGQIYDPVLSIHMKGAGSFDQAFKRSAIEQSS